MTTHAVWENTQLYDNVVFFFFFPPRRSIKVTVVLLPLLGLTWVFGFMAVDENTIFFHYIFATINSLQVFNMICIHVKFGLNGDSTVRWLMGLHLH